MDAELDDEIQAWLLHCERKGIVAIAIMLLDKAIVVRCQDATDVAPLCRRVAAEHDDGKQPQRRAARSGGTLIP